MDQKFFHSVRLDKEKCKGCTNCLKRCPTEAIRVRGGRAHIINERCIDCGECIKVCANHASMLSSIAGMPARSSTTATLSGRPRRRGRCASSGS